MTGTRQGGKGALKEHLGREEQISVGWRRKFLYFKLFLIKDKGTILLCWKQEREYLSGSSSIPGNSSRANNTIPLS